MKIKIHGLSKFGKRNKMDKRLKIEYPLELIVKISSRDSFDMPIIPLPMKYWAVKDKYSCGISLSYFLFEVLTGKPKKEL